MLNVIPANWAVVVRDVGNRHFTDEMLKGPMAAFRLEHQVEVGGGGSSSLGIMPASESGLALTMIMNRMGLSPMDVRDSQHGRLADV
jgi:hypothetical protein